MSEGGRVAWRLQGSAERDVRLSLGGHVGGMTHHRLLGGVQSSSRPTRGNPPAGGAMISPFLYLERASHAWRSCGAGFAPARGSARCTLVEPALSASSEAYGALSEGGMTQPQNQWLPAVPSSLFSEDKFELEEVLCAVMVHNLYTSTKARSRKRQHNARAAVTSHLRHA